MRESQPSKLGRATDRTTSLPRPSPPRNTRVATASIRQEFSTFGIQRNASLATSSLYHFRFTPCTSCCTLALSLSPCHFSPPSPHPSLTFTLVAADIKGRQKAIEANRLVARRLIDVEGTPCSIDCAHCSRRAYILAPAAVLPLCSFTPRLSRHYRQHPTASSLRFRQKKKEKKESRERTSGFLS